MGRRAAADGAELKFHDIDVDQAGADLSAGVILNTSSISLIGQGVTESTRVGRKCVVKAIGWRGNIQLETTAGAGVREGAEVRLMVVQDKQCNGAAPSVTGTGGVLESANIHSFNNLNNKGRFRVLSDQTYQCNVECAAGNGTTNDTPSWFFPFSFFKSVNIPLEFSGTADPAVIAEVRTNNLFVLMIANTADTGILLDSKIRLRFSDG